MSAINKDKAREYQKRYIDNHSKLITCDVCHKTYKEYRSRYHPFLKRHIKSLELQKINNENKNNDKKNNNLIVVYFD